MTKSAVKPAATKSGLSKPSQAVSATFAKALSKTTAKVKTKAAAGSTPMIAQKTARKPTAKAVTKTAAVKPVTTPAVAVAVEKPVVAGGAEAVVLGPEMRKKELIDRVVSRSGIKKKAQFTKRMHGLRLRRRDRRATKAVVPV